MRAVSSFLPKVLVLGIAIVVCAGLSLIDGSAGASDKTPSPGKTLTVERIFSDPPLVPPAPPGSSGSPTAGDHLSRRAAQGEEAADAPRRSRRALGKGTHALRRRHDRGARGSQEGRRRHAPHQVVRVGGKGRPHEVPLPGRDLHLQSKERRGPPPDARTTRPRRTRRSPPTETKIAFTRANDLWVLDLETRRRDAAHDDGIRQPVERRARLGLRGGSLLARRPARASGGRRTAARSLFSSSTRAECRSSRSSTSFPSRIPSSGSTIRNPATHARWFASA